MKTEYMVICQNVMGSGSFEIVYNSDGKRFADREDAIAHGFTLDRSDDFNIGVVQNNKLIGLGWMENKVDEGSKALREISKYIGLSA